MSSLLKIALLITSPIILTAIGAIGLSMLPIIAVSVVLTLLANLVVFTFKVLCVVAIAIVIIVAALIEGVKKLISGFGDALETLGTAMVEGVTSLAIGLTARISALYVGISDGLTNLYNNIKSFFTRSSNRSHAYPYLPTPPAPSPANEQQYAEFAHQYPYPSAPPKNTIKPRVTPQWELWQAEPHEARATYDTAQQTEYSEEEQIPVAEIVLQPLQQLYRTTNRAVM